jgi:two-component sensor histidine kinase
VSAVRLVATELVTNAYRHGGQGGSIDFSAHLTDEHVHLAVRSPSGATAPTPSNSSDGGGWGLQLVDSIAEDWGVDDDHVGSVSVWARIPRHL